MQQITGSTRLGRIDETEQPRAVADNLFGGHATRT